MTTERRLAAHKTDAAPSAARPDRWTTDGRADSLDRWAADPLFAL
ncbi:hypothetical protein [Urbifossiella limnaea]|uniref:Uncharacterized protein n=1 Tax=Urbifossiella limnaea TaxID=2528023 RepID=A0A517XUS9_9BACT|nr:hypothetical protein [Urbifossiella limnaea]QDU21265.1 hypothetical protein ETAA1_32310 [Urbifossiella limnaea]